MNINKKKTGDLKMINKIKELSKQYYYLEDFYNQNEEEFIELIEEGDLRGVRELFENNEGYIVDGEVCIYNSELLNWLTEDQKNVYYVEDVIKEGLIDTNDFDMFRAIQAGQYRKFVEEFYKEVNWFIDEIEELIE